MIAEKLKKAFNKYYKAPIEAWKHFVEHCNKVEYNKKDIIKQLDKIENYGYFLLKGAVCVFV